LISQSTIEAVKGRANVLEVVGDFVKLKRNGASYLGACPFHNEKTPSFSVNKEKGIYKCFGCGKSGDAIAFLVEHEKLDYVGAIRWLAKKYNIEIDEDGKEFVKPAPRLEKISAEFIEGFEKRGISNDTLLRFKITEAVEWMPIAKAEVKAVCFNYFRGEELINIKYRAKGKDFKLAKDAELIFYNINALENEKVAVIVEGEIDCLTMHECGIYNCVSVPNGAAKGAQKLPYLDNCYQYFTGIEKIILAVDNDEPGQLLREELGRRLGKERCFWVNFLDCKDANEVLTKYGRQSVVDIVELATAWPLEGIIHVSDLDEEIVDYFQNGYPKGAKAHIPGFDNYLSFVPGQMTMVTGIPGHGKDEFLNLIMVGLSRYENWSFAICGFEEPASINVTKLQEKYTGRAFDFRKDPIHRMNQEQFINSLNFIKKFFYYINLQMVGAKGEDILAKAAELVMRYGIKGLIINPWNCLEHCKGPGQSETEYISEFLTTILNFAVKHGVHVFLVAHPTKINKDKQTRKYEIPTLYNISGSAHFYNKTYNGICVYRDTETNIVDVYIQKVKWSWLGKLGFCTFSYDTFTRQYFNIGESHPPMQEEPTTRLTALPAQSVRNNYQPEFDDLMDEARPF
jgi:twinkle protein